MKKTQYKKDSQYKKKKQDAVTNQVLLVFVGAAVLLWGVSFLYDALQRRATYRMGMIAACVLAGLSVVGAVICALLYMRDRKSGKIDELAVFHIGLAALFLAGLALCCAVLIASPYYGMRALYVMVPCLAILFLFYQVYDHLLFTLCICGGLSALSLFLLFRPGVNASVPVTAAAVLLAAAACVLMMLLSLRKPEERLRTALLGHAGRREVLVIGAGLLAVLACGAIFRGTAALVLLIATAVFVMAAAVYFTVKLM